MIKKIFALARGQAFEATENYTDKHAIVILRQQIRDASQSVLTARKSVAIAIAQHEQEQAAFDKIVSRIKELEERTVAALENKKQDLAQEGAEMIAYLEAERDTAEKTLSTYSAEISRLKITLADSEKRLMAIKRGQRLAQANHATHNLQVPSKATTTSSLEDAESTLARLQNRQHEVDRTTDIMREMEKGNDPKSINEKLSKAGCGTPLHSDASSVLARLNAKTQKSK